MDVRSNGYLTYIAWPGSQAVVIRQATAVLSVLSGKPVTSCFVRLLREIVKAEVDQVNSGNRVEFQSGRLWFFELSEYLTSRLGLQFSAMLGESLIMPAKDGVHVIDDPGFRPSPDGRRRHCAASPKETCSTFFSTSSIFVCAQFLSCRDILQVPEL